MESPVPETVPYEPEVVEAEEESAVFEEEVELPVIETEDVTAEFFPEEADDTNS